MLWAAGFRNANSKRLEVQHKEIFYLTSHKEVLNRGLLGVNQFRASVLRIHPFLSKVCPPQAERESTVISHPRNHSPKTTFQEIRGNTPAQGLLYQCRNFLQKLPLGQLSFHLIVHTWVMHHMRCNNPQPHRPPGMGGSEKHQLLEDQAPKWNHTFQEGRTRKWGSQRDAKTLLQRCNIPLRGCL